MAVRKGEVDSAIPAVVQGLIDQSEREAQRRKALYRRVFGTDAGQALLEELKKAFVYTTSHYKGDAYESAFREGRRALVLEIMSLAESREE